MFPEYEFLYPFMVVLGLTVGFTYIIRAFWHKRLSLDTLQGLLIITFFSGLIMLVGAFIFDSIFHYASAGTMKTNGITFLSGLLCGIGAFCLMYIIFFKKEKAKLLAYLNIIITGVVISHAFGRLGCLFDGCCFGVPTDAWWGIVYPEGTIAYNMYGSQPLIPTQIIESIFLFILAFVLLKYNKHQVLIYTLSYGVFRFIIEFYRGDDRGSKIFGFHPSQFISLLMIVGGIIWLAFVIIYRFKEKKASNSNKENFE